MHLSTQSLVSSAHKSSLRAIGKTDGIFDLIFKMGLSIVQFFSREDCDVQSTKLDVTHLLHKFPDPAHSVEAGHG